MITVEEVSQRLSKALAALDEKRQSMTGTVTNTSALQDEPDMMHAFVGQVLMTLSAGGNRIEPETFSRTMAVMIMAARHFGVRFMEPTSEQLETAIDDDTLYFYARMQKTHLVARVSEAFGELVAVPQRDNVASAVSEASGQLIVFLVMHGMNETELITDIPSDIDIKI